VLAGGICPNLVEFYDAFWEDPFMYLAMEFMDHGYIKTRYLCQIPLSDTFVRYLYTRHLYQIPLY